TCASPMPSTTAGSPKHCRAWPQPSAGPPDHRHAKAPAATAAGAFLRDATSGGELEARARIRGELFHDGTQLRLDGGRDIAQRQADGPAVKAAQVHRRLHKLRLAMRAGKRTIVVPQRV